MRRPLAAVLLLLALLLPRPARADVVTTWMDVADWVLGAEWESYRSSRTGANSRTQALTALAMFEAVNAIDRRFAPLLPGLTAAAGASPEAAAAHAAYTVLVSHFPGRKEALDDALLASLAGVAPGPGRTAGEALGRAAGTAALARWSLPAAAKPIPYRPSTTPGRYVDPGLPYIQPFDTLLPPILLARASELRPAGPPALTSARYARDLDEVRRLGAKVSTERPRDRELLAPVLLDVNYNAILRRQALAPGRTLLRNARLYAATYAALEDAWLAVQEAKMHYQNWRPITAIRNADQDGNDATTADPGWLPLLRTPTHPDYPCGHCTVAAAVATVLEAEVGPSPAGGITIESYSENPGVRLTVRSWKEFVDEMSMSRIYAGAHTRAANEDAEAIGREVGRRALARWPAGSVAAR